MSFSRGAIVRGRVEAGVQRAGASSVGFSRAAWELEELPLPAAPAVAFGIADAPVGLPADDFAALEQREAELDAARRARHAAETERARADGHAAGLAQGRAEGAAMAWAQYAEGAEVLGAAVAQLKEEEARYLHGLEENLAALAVAVARHLIGREVRQDASIVADLVRRALAEFPVDQPVRVRVHPLDLSAITAATAPDGTPVEVAPARDLTWLADPRVQRGGAMLEGRERVVDGRVDVALERAFRRLANSAA